MGQSPRVAVRAKSPVKTKTLIGVAFIAVGLAAGFMALSALQSGRSAIKHPRAGVNFYLFSQNNPSDLLQEETLVANLNGVGAEYMRQLGGADVSWTIQPGPDGFAFEETDAVLFNENIPQERVATLFGIHYASPNAPWVTAEDEFQKTMGTDARYYVETVVKRYKDVVDYWEIGNEMDSWINTSAEYADQLPANGVGVTFSPQEQGIFFKEVASLIRKNDPTAYIVMPGMHLGDNAINTWLPGVIETAGKKTFDIVNFHYYGSDARFASALKQLNTQLTTLGISSKPVWMTETGATSLSPETETSQSEYLVKVLVSAWANGVDSVAVHSYVDSSTGEFAGYGLVAADGRQKLSYWTYKALIENLLASRIQEETIESRQNVYSYKLLEGGRGWVAWGSIPWTVPAGATEYASLIPAADAQGALSWQPVTAGSTITLTDLPIIVR